MKKLALIAAIVLGLSMTTFADGGGLFNRADNAKNGASAYTYFSGNGPANDPSVITPALPAHNQEGNQDAPLGSGIAVLMGLGAAYMVAKKRKED